MIRQKHLICFLILISFGPVLWDAFVMMAPVISRTKTDLFLFVDFQQKSYWYVFYSSQHLNNIIAAFLLFKLNPYKNLNILFKWFLIMQLFRLCEYWLFHGSLTILPLILSLALLGLDSYRAKYANNG